MDPSMRTPLAAAVALLCLTGCGRIWYEPGSTQQNLCNYPEVGACGGRAIVDLGSAIGPAAARGSTTEAPADDPPTCKGTVNAGHAFSWTAPSDGTFVFDTVGSEFTTVLYALLGSCDGPEMACSYEGGTSRFEISAILGDRIVVVLDGAETGMGNYVLNIAQEEVASCVTDGGSGADCESPGCRCAPSCTSCEATDLGSSVGLVVGSGSFDDACDEVQVFCDTSARPDVLFRWTPPDARRYRIDTAGGELGASVTLIEGGGCDGNQIACSVKDPDVGRIRGSFAPGAPLLIAVSSHGNPGSFVLNIEADETGACANGLDDDGDGIPDCADPDCASALSCGEGGLCTNSTDDDGDGDVDCADSDCAEDGACTGASIPGCPAMDLGSALGSPLTMGSTERGTSSVDCEGNDAAGPDVSFLWTAPADGKYQVGVRGEYDTVLQVSLGSCTGRQIACDDASDSATFDMVAGQQIVIFADSHTGGMGGFEIYVVGVEVDCTDGLDNDGDGLIDCEDDQCGDLPACVESGRCATRSCPDQDLGNALGLAVAAGDTSTGRTCGSFLGSCKATEAPERTFLWRAPFSGTFRFDSAGSDLASVVYVLAGGCGGQELACDRADPISEGGIVTLPLQKDESVVIVVDGQHGERGAFQLNVSTAESGRCGNGVDDDQDGVTDCADDDCTDDLFCCGDGGTACVCL